MTISYFKYFIQVIKIKRRKFTFKLRSFNFFPKASPDLFTLSTCKLISMHDKI